MRRRWDIFCTVIDNFGDAGVCWRLARQLAAEFELQVCLWIDDLGALQHLWPEVAAEPFEQIVAGVVIRQWRVPFAPVEVADVVIEAFACTLPETYVAAMALRARPPVWINLEYLSAERWVAECHGLASPQAHSALKKYFFFPGFAAGTGGVLGERDLHARRRAFQTDPSARQRFLGRFNTEVPVNALLVSLFAYDSAPVQALLSAWVVAPMPVVCLVPESRLLARVAEFFGESSLQPGEQRLRGALSVHALPFLRQDEYDLLLWSCDINCVRGEDSFVRAQWAARPLFWQVYPQQDEAHWVKLEAFLDRYKQALTTESAAALGAAWRAWNGRGDIGACWSSLYPLMSELRRAAKAWEERLHGDTNLAGALVQFCANHV